MENIQLTKKDIKDIAKKCGATDVGIISINDVSHEQREIIKKIFPKTKSLISIALKYNPNATKSYYRSISNNGYHNTFKKINSISYELENKLLENHIEAVSTIFDFPMETESDSPATWLVSHKEVAVKAGVGKKGLNSLVIHKEYGPYILLNTLLMNYELEGYDVESDNNPCINCNLCKSICPTGSIREDGFNFMGCYTHNYRDMRSGFLDLTDRLESKNRKLDRINASEKSAIWQSLQYGSNYRCSYCVAVCPAGKNELEEYKSDKKHYFNNYVKPFKEKEENIYVVKGSDTDFYVNKLENKKKKYVSNGLEFPSVIFFRNALKIAFQTEQAKGVNRIYHFIFKGDENIKFTVKIEEGKLKVINELVDIPDFKLTCDSNLWLKFLSSGKGLVSGILTGKAKVKGNLKYLLEFSKYFPT